MALSWWDLMLFGAAPLLSFVGVIVLWLIERRQCIRQSGVLSQKAIQYVIDRLKKKESISREQLDAAFAKMIRVLRRPYASPSNRFIADYCEMLVQDGMLDKL